MDYSDEAMKEAKSAWERFEIALQNAGRFVDMPRGESNPEEASSAWRRAPLICGAEFHAAMEDHLQHASGPRRRLRPDQGDYRLQEGARPSPHRTSLIASAPPGRG